MHHFIYSLFLQLVSCCNALRSGLPYDRTMRVVGKAHVMKPGNITRLLIRNNGGKIIIGKNFCCNNKFTSNSIGLIQPCLFNINTKDSYIIIGDNVGISGSTINATTKITIGDNTIIGSGCLISDTDSHPLLWEHRIAGDSWKHTGRKPIVIGKNVFVGARRIIKFLK